MARNLFRFDDATAVADWRAIDDRVMGGMSRSRLRHDRAGYAVFEGEVSLQRNGGFASVRSPAGALGCPGATHCATEVRGDGRRYKLSLFIDDTSDALSYQAAFMPDANAWSTLRLPIDGFRATFRGRDVPEAPALEAARIRQVGLVIADRQAGAFRLDIRTIGLD